MLCQASPSFQVAQDQDEGWKRMKDKARSREEEQRPAQSSLERYVTNSEMQEQQKKQVDSMVDKESMLPAYEE